MKLSDIIKILVCGTVVVLIVALLNFLLGDMLIGESDEVLCPTHVIEQCVCDVSVDCCCPTETATPTITDTPTVTGTLSTSVPTATSTPYDNTVSPTPTRRGHTPTSTATKRPTSTRTVAPTTPPTQVTPPSPSKTPTVPIIPTETVVVECYQWLCHKTGNAGWKDYCCDSQECVEAHLNNHGDYLERCQ